MGFSPTFADKNNAYNDNSERTIPYRLRTVEQSYHAPRKAATLFLERNSKAIRFEVTFTAVWPLREKDT